MRVVSHVNDVVGLHDDYGCYGVLTKEQFQVIKQFDTCYPVPAISWVVLRSDGVWEVKHKQPYETRMDRVLYRLARRDLYGG